MSVDTYGGPSQTLTFFDPDETEADLLCADTQASDFDYVPTQSQTQADSQIYPQSQVSLNRQKQVW